MIIHPIKHLGAGQKIDFADWRLKVGKIVRYRLKKHPWARAMLEFSDDR